VDSLSEGRRRISPTTCMMMREEDGDVKEPTSVQPNEVQGDRWPKFSHDAEVPSERRVRIRRLTYIDQGGVVTLPGELW